MNLPGAYGKGLNLSKKGKVEKTDINPLTGLGPANVQGCRKYFIPLSYDLKKKKNREKLHLSY